MNNHSEKIIVEAAQRITSALEQMVNIQATICRLQEQVLMVTMGKVQQVDFNTLPEEAKVQLSKQLGLDIDLETGVVKTPEAQEETDEDEEEGNEDSSETA